MRNFNWVSRLFFFKMVAAVLSLVAIMTDILAPSDSLIGVDIGAAHYFRLYPYPLVILSYSFVMGILLINACDKVRHLERHGYLEI